MTEKKDAALAAEVEDHAGSAEAARPTGTARAAHAAEETAEEAAEGVAGETAAEVEPAAAHAATGDAESATGADADAEPAPAADPAPALDPAAAVDSADPEPLHRPRAASRRGRRFGSVNLAAAALAVVLLGGAGWTAASHLFAGDGKPPVTTVTLAGVEYSTNLRLAEHGGYAYAYVPVNAKTEDIVIESGNAADDAKLRDFFTELDTLVPGEHVLSLSATNLHVIVDGMAEDSDTKE